MKNKFLHIIITAMLFAAMNVSGQNSAVGSIPGSFAVSPSGAATYTIPIEIPAGINGMQPNVSLFYNSQGGSGIAGWCWNIGGLSAISRVPKAHYHDDAQTGLMWTNESPLALDGQRLIEVQRWGVEYFFLGLLWTADSIEYKTEVENYTRIVGYDFNIFGASYFKVYTKDGHVIKYGEPINMVSISGNSANFTPQMAISSVTDADGNYMEYRYMSNSGHSQTVLEKIEYTGNGNITPDLSIVFNYSQKAKVQKQYMGEYYLEDYYLLNRITVKSGAETYRKYDLTYNYIQEKYFLQKAELSNYAGEKLPPTTVAWGQDNKTLAVNKSTTNNPSHSFAEITLRSFAAADADGDGVDELIEMFNRKDYNGGGWHSSGYVNVNKLKRENGNIVFDRILYTRDVGCDFDINDLTTKGGIYPATFSGSQKKTILVPRFDEFNGNYGLSIYDIQQNRGIGIGLQTSKMPLISVGDINNDGTDEIIWMEKIFSLGSIFTYTGNIWYIKNNAMQVANLVEHTFSFQTPNVPQFLQEMHIADYDADGLNDLIIITSARSYFLKNNGGTKGADGIVHPSFSQVATNNNIKRDDNKLSRIKFGDFNGDGMTDILQYDGHNNFTVHLNTGNFTFASSVISNITNWDDHFNNARESDRNDNKDDFVVYDYNQDGKSDIIIFDACYRNECSYVILGACINPWMAYDHTKIKWFSSNGNGTFSMTREEQINPTNGCPEEQYHLQGYFATGDFDGDGREDLFSYKTDLTNLINNISSAEGNGFFHSVFNDGFAAKQVIKITDGMGTNTDIDYQPLTFSTNFYTKETNAAYPTADIQPSLYCVKQTSTFNNSGTAHITNDYSYKGLKINRIGKGLLGFTGQSVINEESNIKTETGVIFNYNYCLPEKQTQKVTLTDGSKIADMENTFTCTKSGKLYTALPQRTSEVNYLTAISKSTDYSSYDSYGNLLTSVTRQGDLTTGQVINYGKFGAWCNNVPVSITTTATYNGDTYSRTKTFEYDPKGHITKETSDPDGGVNKVITEYKNFDSFGHPQTVSVTASPNVSEWSAQGQVSRISASTYTPSGRFVKTKTNTLGETTTYNRNETKGLLTSETDHYGRTTSYSYDNWGRLQSTTFPDGNVASTTMQWADYSSSATPAGAKYYSTNTASGSAPVTVWYNGAGQELRRDTKGLNSKDIYVSTEYDSKSRLYRVSEPYFAGADKTWASTTTYDSYGRPQTVVTPMGTTTYAYNDLTTIVTTPEGTQETKLNSAGMVESSTVNGKKVEYTYYASGLTKTATPQDGSAVSMEYDLRGNRTKLTDPDAGVVVSGYTGFGQLAWNSQKVHNTINPVVTTEYWYYADGRLKTETTKGVENVTKKFNYDDRNRLNKIVLPQHTKEFVFDNFDRTVQTIETINGRSYVRQNSYDQYGRVVRNVFPSGYYTDNYYDANGIMYKIADETGRYTWELIEENARGQIIREKKGSKITTFTYDSRGFNTSTYYALNGLTGITYTFDAKGNLIYKSEASANNDQAARYKYDAQNRLTRWEYASPNYATKRDSVTYDESGNIRTKSNIGNYLMNYGEKGKPHALTSIAGCPAGFNQILYTFTDFKKLKSVSSVTSSYSLTYGVDNQRIMSQYTKGREASPSIDTYYLGNYEEKKEYSTGNIQKIHYLCGGVYIENSKDDNEFYYTYTDNLGSLIALVNADGTVAEHYAYDPWGERLNPSNRTQADSRTAWKLARGYTGHEHLDKFGVINMNGRVYDPLTAQFLSPDPYIQVPGNWLNYNRYSYCLNNPFKYTDPSGEIVWFVPVIIGSVIGAYAGASIQSGTAAFWNWKPDAWKGAIAGGIIGATLGYGFAAAIGATGMTTTFTTAAGTTANVTTKAAGLVSSMLNSGSINIGLNVLSGGGWDGAWKAGVVGMASGAWTATGGFGMVKSWGAENAFAKLGGKLGYQMIGTAGSSIGNNWARGENPFSKVILGVGPVNLTLGKGQKLLQWQNNLGNIATNALGLGNLAFGGKMSFDWKNLAPVYTGGLMEKMGGAWGPYSVMGPDGFTQSVLGHEMHHIWQSRSMGDTFLLHYGLQGVFSWLMGGNFIGETNYFEGQAYEGVWW
jgi:RHS repeat-associated protein